ncbi:src-like-adapter 2 [Gadus chalcogrammus]|uniref:src-like-adapter 2 n=1 Tax=Gadus chalcogrammus TaxID=1042646 RepID=UPI0024C47D1E|nr:src-like-adapter 2 [Gadus chalcogrammus]
MGNCPLKFRTKQRSQGNPIAPGLPACSADMNFVVSLHDFPCYGEAGFSLQVGERLSVVSDDGDFLMVKSARTGHEIYVPTECTSKVINRWFFKGLSRYKAEELLMQTHNCTGAFLVRESESNPDQYSLSVLKRPESYLGSVKHYRISRIANGWFYIAQRLTFSSLQHLVQHYTEFTDGLCCTLDKPCFVLGSDNTSLTIPTERSVPLPLAIRRPTINWKDVTRSMLFRGNRAESEHSLVSDGLREAISSYLYMTEINERDFV